MTRRFLLAAMAFVVLHAAGAQEQPPSQPFAKLDKDQVTQITNALSRCAGVYEVVAKLNDGTKPATAKTWRDTARGARFAAMYLLSMEWGLSGKEPKRIGEFAEYVDPLIETSTTQIQALLENGDAQGLQDELKTCIALGDTQKALVQTMRDDINNR